MDSLEELKLLKDLLNKYNLPVSPILHCSIEEQISLYSTPSSGITNDSSPIFERYKELSDYGDELSKMSVGIVQGKKLPHKAILLLAIMNLIESGELDENRIELDNTIAWEFRTCWERLIKDQKAPSSWIPFWYLKSESFWHFMPNGDKNLLQGLLQFAGHPSVGQMRPVISYAYLDNALFEYMSSTEGRKYLRKLLINTYIDPYNSTEKEYAIYAKSMLSSTYKHSDAFRFIEDQILSGASDKDILQEFSKLHSSCPAIYSITGGNTLSSDVLRKFKKGVLANKEKADKKREIGARMGEISSQKAVLWFNNSPAVDLARKRLAQGLSYNSILEELNGLYKDDPIKYGTRNGKPISAGTLSRWAKSFGYEQKPGGNARDNMIKWKKANEGYQWFREQILSGRPQDEIIAKYNELHETNPEAYSTVLGSGMTISTYLRWKREILSETK